MIDAKKAAMVAANYLMEILERRPDGLEVEEIELSDDDFYWLVTLGYDVDPLGRNRKYKVFRIRADSGEVESMKIRWNE
ncbi:MAG: hypothetical protein HY912_12965 [Desulfomonile tiedjei]|uniref:PepSY domain-containing protein n=1 Tax=Desulfomonile tiedjei TaxID=2358 RepID=A0A9D6V2N7_9BACT|nr:hypothetical protein [Desulfomonile tiedjei]